MAEYVEPVPAACPGCDRLRPVLVRFTPCDCAGAEDGGHIARECPPEHGGCGHVVRVGCVALPLEPDYLPDFGQAGGTVES